MHRPRVKHLAQLLTLATLLSAAGAQDRLLGAAGKFLFEYELEAGAVADVEGTWLQPITPFQMPNAQSVGWIDGEVWVGTTDGVLRYGGTPLAYIDRFAQGTWIRGVWASPSGAFLRTLNGPITEVDSNGSVLQTIAFPATVHDIEAYRAGYLVVTGNEVLYTDTNLQFIAEFGPTLATQVWQGSGEDFTPRHAAVLSDGRVAFSSFTHIVIALANGDFQATIQAALFESHVFETVDGLILVSGSGQLGLVHPDTNELLHFAFSGHLGSNIYSKPFSLLPGAASESGRGCTAGLNSTGTGARIHLIGTHNHSRHTLTAIATSLPPATLSMPIFGVNPFDAPFGDGRLCVSPFAPGLTRAPVTLSTSLGSTRTAFDFTTPGLGAAFGPGTTWYFQVLYRDPTGPGGSGFNGTDGVFISFEP